MTRMTKQQLVDENIRLRAHIDVLERRVHDMAQQLVLSAQAQVPSAQAPRTHVRVSGSQGTRPECIDFADYIEYVQACKAWARTNNLRVAGYKTRAQFNDEWNATGPAERDYVESPAGEFPFN